MKKSRAKKLLTLLMVLVVVLGSVVFAGCASNTGSTGGAANQGQSNAQDGESTSGNAPATIKIGIVAPISGPMANFTVGLNRSIELSVEAINKDGGIYIAEYDKKIPVEVILGDSQSSPTIASEVATKLATQDKVNFLIGEWTPETANPVSIVGERYKIPTLVNGSPDESWLVNGPYEWSFAYMFSLKNIGQSYFDAFDSLETNKKIGLVLDSGVDGVGMADAMNTLAEGRGYTVIDPGRFPEGTTDYSSVISKLMSEGCDIMFANLVTPQLNTLWNQVLQLGYKPKVAVLGKGMQLSPDVNTLDCVWACTELEWDPRFPYTSSLHGLTAQELSDDFEKAVGQQADITIGWDYAAFDIFHDVLTRAQSLDPAAIRDAMAATDLDTVYGHIKFSDENVSLVPIGLAQWIPNEKWGVTKNICGAYDVPEIAHLIVPLQPILYD